MYEHYTYCENLARKLKPIAHTDADCHFFRATEQTELQELNDNLSSAHGMIMIAIDGKDSTYRFNGDSLMNSPIYMIAIVKQTSATDSETIFSAQQECTDVAKQVIARMLHDARYYQHNCHLINGDSFRLSGFGPIAQNFYGVMLYFTLDEGEEFFIKTDMWL